MSTPGFLFHFIFIAYIWQCVWYYFMGKYIQSVKELPFFSITMSLFFYMEAFNIYSQTVFEDKFLMRTLISFIMGFNFLILTIANRKLIWKKGDKHEQLLSEGDSVQTEIKEGLLNKKGYIKPNTKTKIIFALLVIYLAVCSILLLVFELVLPKAMAMSVVPCVNYGLAAETLFRTKRPSNALMGMVAYYPFIALICMYRVLEGGNYGYPMSDDPWGFYIVGGFTTFKILMAAFCSYRRNKKQAELTVEETN